jgi:hypothetical protein
MLTSNRHSGVPKEKASKSGTRSSSMGMPSDVSKDATKGGMNSKDDEENKNSTVTKDRNTKKTIDSVE